MEFKQLIFKITYLERELNATQVMHVARTLNEMNWKNLYVVYCYVTMFWTIISECIQISANGLWTLRYTLYTDEKSEINSVNTFIT